MFVQDAETTKMALEMRALSVAALLMGCFLLVAEARPGRGLLQGWCSLPDWDFFSQTWGHLPERQHPSTARITLVVDAEDIGASAIGL